MRAKVGRRRRMKYRPGHAERRPLLPAAPTSSPRRAYVPTRTSEDRATAYGGSDSGGGGGGMDGSPWGETSSASVACPAQSPPSAPPAPPASPRRQVAKGHTDRWSSPSRSSTTPSRLPRSPVLPCRSGGGPRTEHRGGPPPFASFRPPASSGDPAAAPPAVPLPVQHHCRHRRGGNRVRPTHCSWLVSSPSIKPSSRPCCGTVTPPCRWPLRTRKKRTTGATAAAAAAGAGAPAPHRRARPTAGCCLHQLGGRPPPRCQTNGEREGDQLSHALAKTRPTVRGWG